MSFGTLLLLIGLAWLSYPIIGGISVQRAIVDGNRRHDAGFSVMPALLVFPPLLLGFAMAVDYVAMPWGRWIVAIASCLMLSLGWLASLWNLLIIYRAKNRSQS